MSRKPLAYKNLVLYNDSQIPRADFLGSQILYPLEISKFLFFFISVSCCLSKESPWLHNCTMFQFELTRFAREVLVAVCINILFITPLVLSEKLRFFFTINQHQSLDSVGSKTKLLNRLKSECKLSKFTTIQVQVSQLQKKKTDRKPPITAH